MMTEMNAVKNRTGNGVLRRGVALLAVLLLVSVLMAGAVSAGGTMTLDLSSEDQISQKATAFSNEYYNKDTGTSLSIDKGKWYFTIPKGDASYATSDSVSLNGQILSSDTIKVSVGNNNWIETQLYELTETGLNVSLALVALETPTAENRLVFTIGTDTTATVTVPVLSNSLTAQKAVAKDESKIHLSYPNEDVLTTFTETPLLRQTGWDHLVYLPMQKGSETIDANTIFMTKKVLTTGDTTSVSYGFTGPDSYNSGHALAYYMPLKETTCSWKYTVATTDRYGPLTYDITFGPNPAEGTVLLIPGVNVNGVAWSDNSNGWTLAISESGSYKLTESFNLKSMTVSKDEVTIDGGYNKETRTGNTITAVGTDSTIITLSGETTLKNCNIVAADSISQDKYATNGFILASKKLTLQNSVINLGKTTDTSGSSILLNLKADGSTISGNTLTTGKSTTSSSQGILLYDVKTVTIENNVINLNAAKSDATSSGSMGVRLYGNAGSDSANIVIKGNTFNTMEQTTARESGISIDTTAAYSGTIANPVTIAEISGNTFNLAAGTETTSYGTVIYLNPKKGTGDSATVALTAVSGNKITKGTHVLYADKAESDNAASITISGSITGNDFAGITGDKFGKKADGLTVTDSSLTWTNNILPVVPDVPVEVTGDTVKVSDETKFVTDTTGAATITGEGANIVITPPEGGAAVLRDSTSGEVTIPDGSTIEAKYNDAPVSVPDTNLEGTTFSMTLELDAVASDLPVPRPAFSEEVKDRVIGQNSLFEPAAMITAESTLGTTLKKVTLVFKIKKTWKSSADLSKFRLYHVGSSVTVIPCTTTEETDFYVVTATSNLGFSSYVAGYDSSTPVTPPVNPPQPAYSSGDGNMENAFRVLFETQGGSYVSPATGLSYGDKITAPVNPVRDGYTFGGWYKDAACTQARSFSDAIDGDMTLYAKWTGGSAAQQTTTKTAAPTAQPTTKATTAPASTTSQSQAAATTAAPAATTAAGVSPTLTQAPAPVFGALLGLLAAGVLLRRRE